MANRAAMLIATPSASLICAALRAHTCHDRPVTNIDSASTNHTFVDVHTLGSRVQLADLAWASPQVQTTTPTHTTRHGPLLRANSRRSCPAPSAQPTGIQSASLEQGCERAHAAKHRRDRVTLHRLHDERRTRHARIIIQSECVGDCLLVVDQEPLSGPFIHPLQDALLRCCSHAARHFRHLHLQ